MLLLKCNGLFCEALYVRGAFNLDQSLLSGFGNHYIYATSVLNCRKCECSAYGCSKLIQCKLL